MHPIDIALHIVTESFSGRTGADGYPSVLHPIAVGMMGHTDEEKTAGFLHDVVEECGLSYDGLLDAGIPSGIVNALRLLECRRDDDQDEVLTKLIASGNPIALQVKFNDLTHDVERWKAFPEILHQREKALERVRKAVEDSSRVDIYGGPENPDNEVAVFACGCFWGAQYQFDKEPGVKRTLAGYTGGEEAFPSYADVRDHRTHHVEAVIVEFDPSETDFSQLCKVFFEIHDPAQTDGVGPDLGPQYRSCLFYRNEEQRRAAMDVIRDLESRGYEVNTLVLPSETFYIGEEYHQRYYEKTGGEPYCHIREKKF